MMKNVVYAYSVSIKKIKKKEEKKRGKLSHILKDYVIFNGHKRRINLVILFLKNILVIVVCYL
jgi:hypothetical protein